MQDTPERDKSELAVGISKFAELNQDLERCATELCRIAERASTQIVGPGPTQVDTPSNQHDVDGPLASQITWMSDSIATLNVSIQSLNGTI